MNGLGSNAGRIVRWLPAAIAIAHAASLSGVVPVDDDFIVYRYARNLLEHGELCFNEAAAPSDGVTTVGWLLLVLPAVAIGVPPEWWSPLVGAAAFAACAAVTARAAARLAGSNGPGLAAGLLVALSPAAAWHAVAGLGTVVTALALAVCAERGLAAFGREAGAEEDERRRGGARRACGLAAAVAVLLRPEVVCVVAGFAASRNLRRAGTIAPPLLAFGALCAWRQWNFGHPLPAAASLKALPLADELAYGWAYALRSLGEGGLAALLGAASLCFLRDGPVRWIGMACAAGLSVTLLVGGDWMVYGRLFVPFLPLGALGVLGWPALWRPAAALFLGVSLVGFGARPQAAFENRFFERHWLAVGDALAARAPAGAAVALSPVGAIGWRSGLPIVDVLGLTHDAFADVDPDLDGVGVKGHHRHDGAWVLDQRPEYLLLGNARFQPDTGRVDINPWEADIAADPRFAADYVTESFELEPGGERVPYARLRSAPRL